MNLRRILGPVSAPFAAAAFTGLAVLAARAAVTLTRDRGICDQTCLTGTADQDDLQWYESTGGCTPDEGIYPEGRLHVHGIDGTNQGLALALIRERIADDDETPGLELDYDEVLRSCVEVAIHLAMNLSDGDCDFECLCEDEDCDGINYELLHLVAGRKMARFASSFEAGAASHAAECTLCDHEGVRAPGYLRSGFCRDIADDLMLNPVIDTVTVRGVPIPAVVDVLCAMLEVVEQTEGESVPAQLDRLAAELADSIARKEAHEAPQS